MHSEHDISLLNENLYDDIVDDYHNNTYNLLIPRNHEQMNEFYAMLPDEPIILDIACGTGRDAEIFTKKGAIVYGMDISTKMLGKATETAPKANFLHLNVVTDRIIGTYDGAWCQAGLLTIRKADIQKALRNIASGLLKNAPFFASIKEGVGEGISFDERYQKEKFAAYYAEKEFSNELNKAGFSVFNVERLKLDYNYHTHPWLYFWSKKI